MARLEPDGRTVVVEKNDTLSEIARDYGNGLSYTQLAQMNGIKNPDLIYVGQRIKVKPFGEGLVKRTSGSPNRVTVTAFGIQSSSSNSLFATWSWSRSNTDKYEVEWYYYTGDNAGNSPIWFVGSKTTTEDQQSIYSIPANAKQVRVRIKPISKTYKSNDKETSYWTAVWCDYCTFNVSDAPPSVPPVPTVEIEEYTLTASLDNLDVNAATIQFQVAKNNNHVVKICDAKINETNYASFSCVVEAGAEYKVRCRSYRAGLYSDWSDYSANVTTMPSAPSGITVCRASSETSVYLEWTAVQSAETYTIEYAEKQQYFDNTDQTTTKAGIEFNHFELMGLESGKQYFFRVRAVNSKGNSPWSGLKSVVIGKKPDVPTTWSSTTTVITGEPLTLYWVHNTQDESSQTYAELELYIDGVKETKTIKNTASEEDKDKTSSYTIDTSSYIEGTTIQWRVRTAGITLQYGDWSVQRTVDVYAPPTLELGVTDINGDMLETLTCFPFYIAALAGPNTQKPIGYHLTITSNEVYETVDNVGNFKMVNKGEKVYSKHFDISDPLVVELSANNVDLENSIEYTVTCTVSMNSGLTAESSVRFNVSWTDESYSPNAEISLDEDTLAAYIRPFCEELTTTRYKVVKDGDVYVTTDETVEAKEIVPLESSPTVSVYTTEGDQVFYGKDANDTDIYLCEKMIKSLVEDVTLSVYRREFDGSFTEIGKGLANDKQTFVTDPHPSLDYARYRIIATTIYTGAVGYYDVPGLPVNESAVIIQWDEQWSKFETNNADAMEKPAWSGSLLKLPYNIDVSNSYAKDEADVEYAGREHPVSYYGTQKGEKANWKVDIEASDKETLYALRRLAIYMGNVYVREPSGSGYWASINVSFSQTHCELTIPVTINITRVEGGV